MTIAAFALTTIASVAAQQVAPMPPPADVAKPPADAVKTASGLASKVLQPGTGTEIGRAHV